MLDYLPHDANNIASFAWLFKNNLFVLFLFFPLSGYVTDNTLHFIIKFKESVIDSQSRKPDVDIEDKMGKEERFPDLRQFLQRLNTFPFYWILIALCFIFGVRCFSFCISWWCLKNR
jgi:hypothetical protein